MKQDGPEIPVLAPERLLGGLVPAPRSALIVRSGPSAMLESAIGHLRSAFPGIRIVQLCHAGHEREDLENIVYPREGYFRARHADTDLLRGEKFDLALALYATDRRLHPEYHEVDAIAVESGARRVVVLYWDGLAAELTPEALELKKKTVLAPWLERMNSALREISAFTGEDPETVRDKCDLAAVRGNELWRSLSPATDREIEAFYRGTDFYIYALMKECDWRGARSGVAEQAVEHLAPGDRALDYGGGVGTLCLELSGRGFELSHLDLPGPLIEFAAHRFRARGLGVDILPAFEQYPLTGAYDAIFCTHVLEHLPDPERKLIHMARHLRSAGRMFLAVPFEPNAVAGTHPDMHLNRLNPESLERVMRSEGLELFARSGELDIYRKTGI